MAEDALYRLTYGEQAAEVAQLRRNGATDEEIAKLKAAQQAIAEVEAELEKLKEKSPEAQGSQAENTAALKGSAEAISLSLGGTGPAVSGDRERNAGPSG